MCHKPPRFHQSTVCGSALDRSCIPPPRISPSFVEFSDCWTVLISIFPGVPESWCHLAGSETTPSRRCPARLQRGIFTYQAPQPILHYSISSVFKEPAAHWALCGENLAEEQLYISCFSTWEWPHPSTLHSFNCVRVLLTDWNKCCRFSSGACLQKI